MPLPHPYLRMRGPAAALVALLAAPCVHGQVTIVPRHALLDPGQAMTLKVLVQADPESKGDSKAETKAESWVWRVEGADGLIDPASGRFTAPKLQEPRVFRVQLRAKERPAVVAEAEIRVQAGSAEAAGGGWFSLGALPTATELPFMDLASGRRFDPEAKVADAPVHVLPARMVGYGLPQRLDWLFGFLEPAALLSYGQGNQWATRLVVSGQEPERVFHHPTVCHREGLSLSTGRSGEWWSQRQTQEIRVRGVGLLAGHPEQRGYADGPALDARFAVPSGLAWLPRAEGEAPWLLAAEWGNHAIRALTPRGEVITFSGKGLDAGAQDGPAEQARFRDPWALLARTDSAGRPEVLVADSGNHAIRRIAADGSVSTLAGALGQPGEARDGALAEARFNAPRALALEADGAVLVADAGNGVIRRIGSDGQITTLRGRPAPGCLARLDGQGTLRFAAPNALAVGRGGMADLLFILDGNQLCGYRRSTGDLWPLLGNGERLTSSTAGTRAVGPDLARKPALNRPTALAMGEDGLWIAEAGSGLVHKLSLTATGIPRTLAAMAGVPGATPRPGLLLDGLPGPGLADHAALGLPWALLPGERPGQLLVAGPGCILRLDAPPTGPDSAAIGKIPLKVQAGGKGEPWTATFQVEGPGPGGQTDARPVRYFVDFIHQDGTLGSRHEGWGQAAAEISVQGRFLRPGTHTVLVRALKPEGIAGQAQAQVAVSAEEAAAHGEHRITVAPRRLTLRQGQTTTFTVVESGSPATPPKAPLDPREERKLPAAAAEPAMGASPWRWTAVTEDDQPCAIDEATGAFTAGAGTRPFQVRVRATHGESGLFAEGLVQVLPDATLGSRPLTGLMLEYLGAAAEDAYGEDLPFLERPFETKHLAQRMGPEREVSCQVFHLPQALAGMGLPFQLDLRREVDGVGRLFTLLGDSPRRLDVTGKAGADVSLDDRYGLTQTALETLLADPSRPGALLSEVRFRNLGLLGLGRVAGKPFPGHRDGPEGIARFRQPAGMTCARNRFDRDQQLLIADPEAHLVRFRRSGAAGLEIGTLCGQDGQAGHRDGPATEALFNGPTCITHRPLTLDRPGPKRGEGQAGETKTGQEAGGTGEGKPAPSGLETKQAPVGLETKQAPVGLETKQAPSGLETKPAPSGLETKQAPVGLETKQAPSGLETKQAPAGLETKAEPTPAKEAKGTPAASLESWVALVADSGNQVLRLVQADGTVSTLAGSPGQAGWADGRGAEARFQDPRGVAWLAPYFYVADRGNHVLRRVGLDGQVETVAGAAGSPGDSDGAQARFSELKALVEAGGQLYLLDGHAVRHYNPRTHQVTTLAGQVASAGHLDLRRSEGLLKPCLNQPADLCYSPIRRSLFIADQGNHAIRELTFDQAGPTALVTRIGDPGERETRTGLFRDGLPLPGEADAGPLDRPYAAVAAPRGLAQLPGTTRVLVSTGHGLMGFMDAEPATPAEAVQPIRVEAGAAVAGGPCRVAFRVELAERKGMAPQTVHVTVDFFNADGSLAERQQLRAVSGEQLLATGVFPAAGECRVLVKAVTAQGISSHGRAQVRVVPGPGPG